MFKYIYVCECVITSSDRVWIVIIIIIMWIIELGVSQTRDGLDKVARGKLNICEEGEAR